VLLSLDLAADTTNHHDQSMYRLRSVGVVWCGAVGYIEQGDDGATSQIRRSRVLRPGARTLARLSLSLRRSQVNELPVEHKRPLHSAHDCWTQQGEQGRSSRCRPLQDAIRVMTRKGCEVSRPDCRLPTFRCRLVVQAHLRVAT
jgi:hypothetical protein